MDSVTQLVLGSTIGHAIGGKQLGRKAIVWGAVIGTLPDLDVLLSPILNDVEQILYHRSHTHALFWQALSAPFVSFIIALIHRQFKHYWRWLLISLLGLWTHALIDWGTTYGTYLLLPFDDQPYALSILFIIDPLFTLPLIIALIVGLWKPNTRHHVALVAIILSTSYAASAWVIQKQVLQYAITTLQKKGIRPDKIIATPMPLSIFWWRVVAIDKHNWYEGVHALWHKKTSQLTFNTPIRFITRSRNNHLLTQLRDSWSVEKLKKFSAGFYRLKQIQTPSGAQIIFSNLKMGFDQQFVFSYLVAEQWNGEWRLVEPAEQLPFSYQQGTLSRLIKTYF